MSRRSFYELSEAGSVGIVKLRLAISRLLVALAIVGLMLAPLARPAMAEAMKADLHVGMGANASDNMGMPADMPCCPDQAPVPDCGKDCPLMAMCLASMVLNLPASVGLALPVTAAGLVLPGNDQDLSSLGHGPPPRPPKA
jgi:hypothetical protein